MFSSRFEGGPDGWRRWRESTLTLFGSCKETGGEVREKISVVKHAAGEVTVSDIDGVRFN